VRYEDITGPNKIAQMEKILRFLDFAVIREKIECAFLLAENPKVRRHVDPVVDLTLEKVYSTAYQTYSSKHVACTIYSIIHNISALNYDKPQTWADYDCASFL